MQANQRGRIYTSALGLLLLVPAMLGLGGAGSVGIAISFMVLFGLGWGFFDSNNMPILCQITHPEYRATGYGLMNFVGISISAGATVVLGWMRDQHISFTSAFVVCAALALFSAVLILFVKPRSEIRT